MKSLLINYIMLTNLYAISATEVYNIAKYFTNYPSTIVGMAAQESSLGKQILGDDGKSLGTMQIQVPTARWTATKDNRLAWINKLSDKELQTLLLRSDTVSIQLACIHFEYYRKREGYKYAVMRHNGLYRRLPNGKRVLNTQYYNKIRKRIARFKGTSHGSRY